MVILGIAASVGSSIFGDAALGDAISIGSGLAFGAWIGAIALCFGGLAFMLAPMLGRAGSAGIASMAMIVLWLANGVEGLDALAVLSPFRWTADHIPLVALYDWPPVVATAALGVAFLAVGVVLFVRRDLGVTLGLGLPKLPAFVLGVRNPFVRAFGDMLPRALAWGIGLGLMGAMLASLVGPMSESLRGDTELLSRFQLFFPDFDLNATGGWLQLFGELMLIAFGFAGATFVAKWASDETEDRLEVAPGDADDPQPLGARGGRSRAAGHGGDHGPVRGGHRRRRGARRARRDRQHARDGVARVVHGGDRGRSGSRSAACFERRSRRRSRRSSSSGPTSSTSWFRRSACRTGSTSSR